MERNCTECVHYVAKAARPQRQGWCAGYIQITFGCEVWECKFKAKNKDRNGGEKS